MGLAGRGSAPGGGGKGVRGAATPVGRGAGCPLGGFGWFGRYRGLAKDYEQVPTSSEAMVLIAMIQLMLKRLAPPS